MARYAINVGSSAGLDLVEENSLPRTPRPSPYPHVTGVSGPHPADLVEITSLRRSILDGIERGIGIRLDGDVRDRCAQNDDAFDAFICALTARAVALERTYLPDPGEEERRARIEGWIHVPFRGVVRAECASGRRVGAGFSQE